jgi:hypothetical protein
VTRLKIGQPHRQLPHIIRTNRPPPRLPHYLHRREQRSKQNGSYRDNNQEFNKRKRWLLHVLLFLNIQKPINTAVIYRKLSFGTQSAAGSRYLERILTVSETCPCKIARRFSISSN